MIKYYSALVSGILHFRGRYGMMLQKRRAAGRGIRLRAAAEYRLEGEQEDGYLKCIKTSGGLEIF